MIIKTQMMLSKGQNTMNAFDEFKETVRRLRAEDGIFTLDDVVRGINEKMIRRHPHVFGNEKVKDSREVLANREEIKKREKIGKEDDSRFPAGAFDEAEDLIGRARRRKGLFKRNGYGSTI